MKEARIIDSFRRSGDANLGRTLIRLARLAESVHQHENARLTGLPLREDRHQVEGINLGPAVLKRPAIERTRSRRVHTEVDR